MENFNNYYTASLPDRWSGRNDGEGTEHRRIHQVIEMLDLDSLSQFHETGKAFALLSFASDEGVRRNKGRLGAKEGAEAIVKAMASLSVLEGSNFRLFDAGTFSCENQELEASQKALGLAVSKLLSHNYFPVILGGGHEVSFGHFTGFQHYLEENEPGLNEIGILNFDAHFDLRKPENGVASSGTPFYQAFQEVKTKPYSLIYQVIGLQAFNNTQALFDIAEENGVQFVLQKDFHSGNQTALEKQIERFLAEVDHFMLTIDLDVFSASIAPGVSAPAYRGIFPDHLFSYVYRKLLSSPKLLSLDIAEMNPSFDQDHRTARLAASLVFEAFEAITQRKN